jgi:transposase
MARRTFDVVDVTEILIHWHAGRSINEVADSLGLDRKTVRKYVDPARQAGMAPGGPAVGQAEWARLVMGWFPHLADTRLNKVTWPQIAVHHDYIKAQLGCGVTQATNHQRLRDEHGLAASYASLKRYVAANMPAETRRDQVVVLRGEIEPGSEAQIDYGQLGWFVEPRTGQRRKLWAFVMVLACSRHMFVQPTLVMDQQAWTAAHVDAFAFFGGVPRRLVPDNLRTGVDRVDLLPLAENAQSRSLKMPSLEYSPVTVVPPPAGCPDVTDFDDPFRSGELAKRCSQGVRTWKSTRCARGAGRSRRSPGIWTATGARSGRI